LQVSLRHQLLDGCAHRAMIRPVCFVHDVTGPIDDPCHIWQRSVGPVNRAIEVVDVHRPLDVPHFHEISGVTQLLFHIRMVQFVITRVRFIRVDKNELQAFGRELFRKRFKVWRRQTTVRSGN
jgi:hypothetical protein